MLTLDEATRTLTPRLGSEHEQRERWNFRQVLPVIGVHVQRRADLAEPEGEQLCVAPGRTFLGCPAARPTDSPPRDVRRSCLGHQVVERARDNIIPSRRPAPRIGNPRKSPVTAPSGAVPAASRPGRGVLHPYFGLCRLFGNERSSRPGALVVVRR